MPHLWGRFCGLKGEKSTHNSPSWPQRGVVGPNIDRCINIQSVISVLNLNFSNCQYLRSMMKSSPSSLCTVAASAIVAEVMGSKSQHKGRIHQHYIVRAQKNRPRSLARGACVLSRWFICTLTKINFGRLHMIFAHRPVYFLSSRFQQRRNEIKMGGSCQILRNKEAVIIISMWYGLRVVMFTSMILQTLSWTSTDEIEHWTTSITVIILYTFFGLVADVFIG